MPNSDSNQDMTLENDYNIILQELSTVKLSDEKARNLRCILDRSTLEHRFRDAETHEEHLKRKGKKLIQRLLELPEGTFNKFATLYKYDTVVPDTDQLLYLIKKCQAGDPDYWIKTHRIGPHREIALDQKANSITFCESEVEAILSRQTLDDEMRQQIKDDLRLLEKYQEDIRFHLPDELLQGYQGIQGRETSREDRIKLLAILCEVMGRATRGYPLLIQQIDLIQSLYPNNQQSRIVMQAPKRNGQSTVLNAAYLLRIIPDKKIDICVDDIEIAEEEHALFWDFFDYLRLSSTVIDFTVNTNDLKPASVQYVTHDYQSDRHARIRIVQSEVNDVETIINPEIISKALASYLDKQTGEEFSRDLLTVWKKLTLIEEGNVLFEHLINKTKDWWLKHHRDYGSKIRETWRHLASTKDFSKAQNLIKACLAQPGKLWFTLLNGLAPLTHDACYESALIEAIQDASHQKKKEYEKNFSIYVKVLRDIKQPLLFNEAMACYQFGEGFTKYFKSLDIPVERHFFSGTFSPASFPIGAFTKYSLLLKNKACFELLLEHQAIFSEPKILTQILEVDIPDSEKKNILSVALPDKKMLTEKDHAGSRQKKINAQIKKCLSILNTFKKFSSTMAGATLFQKMFDATKQKVHLNYNPLTKWEPNKLEGLFKAILAEPEEIWLKFIQVLKKYPAEELVEKQNMFVAAMVQTKEAKLDEKERVDFFQFYLMASKERADLDVNCLRSYYNYAKKLGYPIESKSLAILIANQIYLPILCELRDKFSYSPNLLRDVLQVLPYMLDENRPQDRWKDLLPVFVDFYNRKCWNIKLLDFSSSYQPHHLIQALVHDFFICDKKDSPWKWTEKDKTAAIDQCIEECVQKGKTLINDQDTLTSEAYKQILRIAQGLSPSRRCRDESMCEGKYLVDHLQTLLTTYRNESNWSRSLSRNSELRKLEDDLILSKDRTGFASTCFNLLIEISSHKSQAIEEDNEINKWRPFWHKHNQKGYSRYLNTLDKMRDYLVSELVKDKQNIITLPRYITFLEESFHQKQAFFKAIKDYLDETKGFSLSALFCNKTQREAVSNFYRNYENQNCSPLLDAINVVEEDLPGHIRHLARDLKFQMEICGEAIPPSPTK